MDLHPFPPTVPLSVVRQQDETRAVNREPRTIQQILTEARLEMEREDALIDGYAAYLRGRPVPTLKHPRRSLRAWLTGRKPEPPPPLPVMTSVEAVWRSEPGS